MVYYVPIVMTKEERKEKVKRAAEDFSKTNLEPMPMELIEAAKKDWRQWWREEKPSERYERLKLRREKKEKEEERENKRKNWEVEDRRKVFQLLTAMQSEEGRSGQW